MPTDQEKEKHKIRFEDLTPSLQARIGKLASKDMIQDLENEYAKLDKILSDIRVTIGYAPPNDPIHMKELYADANYPLFETYSNGRWVANEMVPVGNGNRTIVKCRVIQTPYQRLNVIVGNITYTSSFEVYYGTKYEIRIETDEGYIAGTPSMPVNGTIIGDCVFSVSDASKQ